MESGQILELFWINDASTRIRKIVGFEHTVFLYICPNRDFGIQVAGIFGSKGMVVSLIIYSYHLPFLAGLKVLRISMCIRSIAAILIKGFALGRSCCGFPEAHEGPSTAFEKVVRSPNY